jgi:hypothetical protein
LVQVAELISFMDCTLQWPEAYFATVTDRYFHYIMADAKVNERPPSPTKWTPGESVPFHETAAHVLAYDESMRLFFLATLYRTSLAVAELRYGVLVAGHAMPRRMSVGIAPSPVVADVQIQLQEELPEE